MLWFRILRVACRLAGPDLLAPWRSPLLRWRIETYGFLDARGHPLHADELRPSHVWRFAVRHRAALVRFFRWAASL